MNPGGRRQVDVAVALRHSKLVHVAHTVHTGRPDLASKKCAGVMTLKGAGAKQRT